MSGCRLKGAAPTSFLAGVRGSYFFVRSQAAEARVAEAREPEHVHLVCGLLGGRTELFERVTDPLLARFGPLLCESATFPFKFSDYYRESMGEALWRKFVVFAHPVPPNALAEIKTWTNALEREIAASEDGVPRPVNIDPGLLYVSRLVLATMKDNAHRIYLARGVYAEITLIRRRGRWRPLPCTYPDFRSAEYLAFLERAREAVRTHNAARAGPAPAP
jgi:hypothetical protein